jgi:hypothetical protein
MRDCFFLLRDGPQHIPGSRDMGQIDLGLDFIFAAGKAGRSCGSGCFLAVGTEMFTDEFRLVLLERTGVGFLLGDTYFGENVKNGFALDLQLPCQIVDSNLTHPPFRFLRRFR